MQEQRMTRRLVDYWDLVRKDKPFPAMRQFNPAVIEDVWPHCFVVGIVGRGSITYKCEYMGDAVIAMYGSDLTGHYVDHRVKQFPGIVLLKKLDDLMKGLQPDEQGGSFVNQTGKIVKYRACFLPLGEEDNTVSHIVAGMTCQVF